MSRRTPALLLAAFVVTRMLVGGLAIASTGVYAKVPTDVNLYERYAIEIVVEGRVPYGEVSVEYPPVALPFIAAPVPISGVPYRTLWVLLMLAVDAAGLLAAHRLDRRWGGSGAWWWVGLIPLLGPLVYARFDLIPAVATVWALERASVGRWAATGAWLAVGALAKLWPGLLVPAAVAVARRPGRVLLGGALASVVVLLPFLPVWPELAVDVLGYHAARGIQVESLWANGLLLAALAGYPLEVVREFGADHLASGASALLKTLSTALSLGAVAAGAWWAWRRLDRDDVRGLTAVFFTLLAVAVVVGSVLSPQYLVWLVALGAVTQCDPRGPLRRSVTLLVPAAAVNHVLFPAFYVPLVSLEPAGLVVLTLRNVLLVAIAVTSVLAVGRAGTPTAAASSVSDRLGLGPSAGAVRR